MNSKIKSKIKSVTIITASRSITYTVGETYNGLVLHEIKDQTTEFPDSIYSEYTGYTEHGLSVFCGIEVPMHVQYEAVEG